MALQAKCVRRLGAQQMIVVAAMWLMTCSTTLTEGRLVVDRLLALVRDIAVTAQADIDRVRFGKSGLSAGVWAVAIGAVARCPRMLNFGGRDQLSFIVVAGNTQRLGIGLRQHDFSILGGGVADFALLIGKWRMGEFCHQLGSGGRVGIVTAHAIGRFERLVLVRLLQVCALDVMTIYAESGRRLGEMKIEFGLADLPRFVRNVAGFAAHVEGGMAAAFLRHIQPGGMAAQAEVFFLIPQGRLQQLILIVRGVRIVTLHAVSNCRGMDRTFYVGGIFIGVAGETKGKGRGRDQLYPGNVFIHPNLVATGAAHGHG
jgi:hypothetical protein